MNGFLKLIKQALIVITLIVVAGGLSTLSSTSSESNAKRIDGEVVSLEDSVFPREGVVLPVTWNDFGKQLIETGVIDRGKFESLYESRGGIDEETRRLLYEDDNEHIVINRDNANTVLNVLWAFGLANKNRILEEGPMMDSQFGGDASRFASTGGWTLASGDPMSHYSAHSFVELSAQEQARVENVAKGIFRPCCGNSTFFPDCNHGMAMLGLLELLADQGLSEDEMFEIALAVNSYWFPETHLTLAAYFETKGMIWEEVDPRVVLGQEYSSGQGYQRVLEEMQPVSAPGGGSCST